MQAISSLRGFNFTNNALTNNTLTNNTVARPVATSTEVPVQDATFTASHSNPITQDLNALRAFRFNGTNQADNNVKLFQPNEPDGQRYQQFGFGGNDILRTHSGSRARWVDFFQDGGSGDDFLMAWSQASESGRIQQHGGTGKDTLIAHSFNGNARDKIVQYGGTGADDIRANGGGGDDRIRQYGGEGDDKLSYTLSSGNDRVLLNGGSGNDKAVLSYSNDDNFTIVDARGRVLEKVGNGGTIIKMKGIEDYTLVNRDAPAQ